MSGNGPLPDSRKAGERAGDKDAGKDFVELEKRRCDVVARILLPDGGEMGRLVASRLSLL